MTPARTSFVIATKDRADSLSATVRRLLDTSRCPVIVVDNGSGDDTRMLIRVLAAAHPRGEQLRLIALPENRGAVARNIGVAAASTPYVAFCDDDSCWRGDAPAIAEREFDRHPDLAVLTGRMLMEPSGELDPFSTRLANSPLGRPDGLPGPAVLGFQACAAVVRTSAFTAVGGFSPIVHFRGEEQLLTWDLAAAGWQLCYHPGLVAYHRPSPRRPPGAEQRARMLRNGLLTSAMRRPPARCVSPAVALLRGGVRHRAYRRAVAEAIARLPAALRCRRPLPPELERRVRLCEATV